MAERSAEGAGDAAFLIAGDFGVGAVGAVADGGGVGAGPVDAEVWGEE